MIFIYVENKLDSFSLNREEALPALESQVLEIFSELHSFENVILGLIVNNMMEIKIQPYNKYIWRVVIINLSNNKNIIYQFSTQKVIRLIKDIFADKNLLEDAYL